MCYIKRTTYGDNCRAIRIHTSYCVEHHEHHVQAGQIDNTTCARTQTMHLDAGTVHESNTHCYCKIFGDPCIRLDGWLFCVIEGNEGHTWSFDSVPHVVIGRLGAMVSGDNNLGGGGALAQGGPGNRMNGNNMNGNIMNGNNLNGNNLNGNNMNGNRINGNSMNGNGLQDQLMGEPSGAREDESEDNSDRRDDDMSHAENGVISEDDSDSFEDDSDSSGDDAGNTNEADEALGDGPDTLARS